MTLETFFNMGGYAAYVWSAYAIVASVLLGFLLFSLRQFRNKFSRPVKNSTTMAFSTQADFTENLMFKASCTPNEDNA